MQCPSCSSTNVQKLGVIYESGTSDFNASGNTYIHGNGHNEYAYTNTSGISQTKLAQRATPPKKRGYIGSILLIVIAIALYQMDVSLSVAIPLAGFGLLLGIWSYIYNSRVFPHSYAVWNKKWHCNQCGAIFSVQ